MVLSRKILIGVAVALAVVVSISACSSSGTSASGSTSATGGGQGSAAGSPVKIGVLCSCSGPFGTTIAAAWNVVQAWEKSVNASGGLNGHPVDLTELDNASNPGTAATNAQKIISANPPRSSTWTSSTRSGRSRSPPRRSP
jgi:branched-chain amino acid transport system substrate-binding protein